MKKLFSLVFSFLMIVGLFAQEDSIFNYVPKTSGYLNLQEGFTVQIIGNGSCYNVFNDSRGSTDVIAWKADKKTVDMIVRLRGWNTEGTALYYTVTIDGSKSKTKGLVKQIKGEPDLNGYILNQPKTNDSKINLRSTAGTSGKKVGQYQKGNSVKFTGKVSNKSNIDESEDYWYSVDYSGTPAWIYGRYISFSWSAVITLESLGVVKKAESKSEVSKSNAPDLTDIKMVVSNDCKVYSVFNTANAVMRIESCDLHETDADLVIKSADGKKLIADIEAYDSQFVYNQETGKLFYVSEKYIYGYPGTDEISFIKGNGDGDRIQKKSTYNPNIDVLANGFCTDKDHSYLYFVSLKPNDDDGFGDCLCRYNIKTGELDESDYCYLLNSRLIGVINKSIFVFCSMGYSNKPESVDFYKVENFDNGEISQLFSWSLDALGVDIPYSDYIKVLNFPNDEYAIMSFTDRNGSIKSFVFGVGKGDDVFKYGDRVKGDVFDTFQYDNQVYLASIEYTGTRKGYIHIYKENLFVPVVTKEFDYSKINSPSFRPVKAGFNEKNEITVVFIDWEK